MNPFSPSQIAFSAAVGVAFFLMQPVEVGDQPSGGGGEPMTIGEVLESATTEVAEPVGNLIDDLQPEETPDESSDETLIQDLQTEPNEILEQLSEGDKEIVNDLAESLPGELGAPVVEDSTPVEVPETAPREAELLFTPQGEPEEKVEDGPKLGAGFVPDELVERNMRESIEEGQREERQKLESQRDDEITNQLASIQQTLQRIEQNMGTKDNQDTIKSNQKRIEGKIDEILVVVVKFTKSDGTLGAAKATVDKTGDIVVPLPEGATNVTMGGMPIDQYRVKNPGTVIPAAASGSGSTGGKLSSGSGSTGGRLSSTSTSMPDFQQVAMPLSSAGYEVLPTPMGQPEVVVQQTMPVSAPVVAAPPSPVAAAPIEYDAPAFYGTQTQVPGSGSLLQFTLKQDSQCVKDANGNWQCSQGPSSAPVPVAAPPVSYQTQTQASTLKPGQPIRNTLKKIRDR